MDRRRTALEQDILAAEVGNLPFNLYYRPDNEERPFECRLDRSLVHPNDIRTGLVYVGRGVSPSKALLACVKWAAGDDFVLDE